VKKICLISLLLFCFSLHNLSLQEVYEQAGPSEEYDKFLSLETGQTYQGGLLIGKIFDPISQELQGSEGVDVKILGNGAILDLEGQQIAISYVFNRLDIEDCIILNGNIRYRGDHGLIPDESPYGTVKHVTFYKPHDYAVRMQGAGGNINVTKNIIVDTQNTGWDYIAYTGLSNDWLPTGNCIAISDFIGWYGLPSLTENWTYFSDEEVNADTLRHYVSLCEYGCTAPYAVSWAAPQNYMGQDPQLIDPENGDFRVEPGTPAAEYGCQTFIGKALAGKIPVKAQKEIFSKKKDYIEVGGILSENTFWNADTIIVTDNIEIEDGIELEIAPGCQVIFQDHYKISIAGTITAVGTAQAPILFTSAYPELFLLDDIPLGSWNGLHFWQTSSLNKTSRLEYCTFQYTKALPEDSSYPHSSSGGAISIYNFSKLEITNCTFLNNLAYYGGAIACNQFSNPHILNNLFYHNYAWQKGAALFISNSYPNLNNNTISQNEDLNEDINTDAAAVYNFLSKTQIYNNIIYNNTSNYFEQNQIREPKAYYTKYNNIEDSVQGEGNIDSNPEFSDSANFDFSLKYNSACIDKGNQNLPTLYTSTDLLGNNRIMGSGLDMGAFEYQTSDNEPEVAIPSRITLKQNWPNPFVANNVRAGTKISYSLPQNTQNATLEIYNSKGQLVKKYLLLNNYGSIFWNGRNSKAEQVAAGIYLYRLSTSTSSKTKKLLFLK
jgi:predicted outer membrane repeat protein